MDYLQWKNEHLLECNGVVVGADLTQEWLLPWWWDHYSKHNKMPVTFVDFGLSFEAKEWCEKRGARQRLLVPDFDVPREGVVEERAKKWEDDWGKWIWSSRSAWFKKPLACLQTPYRNTLWIDLDCEIRSSIEELFGYCEKKEGLALAFDPHAPNEFNTGVIAYSHRCPILQTWAIRALEQSDRFIGDQDLFSQIVEEEKIPIAPLPPIYNWSRRLEHNPQARIIHWHGPHGKAIIASQMGDRTL